MQYEPYFSATHECDTATQAAAEGVSPKIFYDALNRPFRTELPDGSFTQTTWTAWEQIVWDNNDTVLESQWYEERKDLLPATNPERIAAMKAAEHANTPTVMHTDTLARPFYTLQYLSPIDDVIPSVVEGYVSLDIQGNRLSVRDGRGNDALQYRYNMLQAPCYQLSIDSEAGRTLLDVAGQPLYAWDAEDREFSMEYDELRRNTGKWLKGTGQLEMTIYGESTPNPEVLNLRGQVYERYDASGKQFVPQGYDFKGNPIESHLQLVLDKTLADPDWDASPPALDDEVFISSATFDALNRPVTQTDPGNHITSYVYDKGGALKKVLLDGNLYVQDIHYDAKGQRQAIWYGNGTKTGYTYDAQTYRLRRLLTIKLSANEQLQDLNYYYDPVGNITEIRDDAQQAIFFNNTVVSPTQQYTYDALYRLIEARGREQKNNADFGSSDNTGDAAMQSMNPLK